MKTDINIPIQLKLRDKKNSIVVQAPPEFWFKKLLKRIPRKFWIYFIVGVFLIGNIIIAQAIKSPQIFRLRADIRQATVSIQPDQQVLSNDSIYQIWITTDKPFAFIRMEITFDPNLIKTSQDIKWVDTFLTRKIKASTLDEINSNGKIIIVYALDPSHKTETPTGTLQLSELHFSPNTTSPNIATTISFITSALQVVGSDGLPFGVIGKEASVSINPVLSNTPTPTPSLSPQDSVTPTSSSTISGTPLPTSQSTSTPTSTPQPTNTPTSSPTNTNTPTSTPQQQTASNGQNVTSTPTRRPTLTPTRSATPTRRPTLTPTRSATPTKLLSKSLTPTKAGIAACTPINGKVEYGPWSPCSVTCGGGIQTRTIQCVNASCGGTCPGDAIVTQACNTEDCPTVISIYAAGTFCNWTYPTMQLLIDDKVVSEWSNIRGNPYLRKFDQYVYQTPKTISASQIKVQNVNDCFTLPFVDRNLRVDKISISGTFYETESKSVYSTGTWSPADSCKEGFKRSEWLHCAGYFQY